MHSSACLHLLPCRSQTFTRTGAAVHCPGHEQRLYPFGSPSSRIGDPVDPLSNPIARWQWWRRQNGTSVRRAHWTFFFLFENESKLARLNWLILHRLAEFNSLIALLAFVTTPNTYSDLCHAIRTGRPSSSLLAAAASFPMDLPEFDSSSVLRGLRPLTSFGLGPRPPR